MSEQGQPQTENALLSSQRQQSIGEYIRSYVQRLSSGDLGSLPIIIGIIAIAIIFQRLNSNFLTPRNFVNLILQMAGITMMAYGVVFVLLLGEIDLSIGYVSAIGGVAVALLLRDPVAGVLPPLLHLIVIPVTAVLLWAYVRSLQKRRSGSPGVNWWIVGFIVLVGSSVVGIVLSAWLWYRAENKEVKRSIIFGYELVAVLLATVFLVYALFNAGLFPVAARWYTVIPIALLATAAIGLLQGTIITYFRVPSFIVTLSGLLAWNGVVLRMIGGSGTVIIQDNIVKGIAGEFLPAIKGSFNGLSLPIEMRVPFLLDFSFLAPLDVTIQDFTISWWLWGIVLLIAVAVGLYAFITQTDFQGSSTRLVMGTYGVILAVFMLMFVVRLRVPDIPFEMPEDATTFETQADVIDAYDDAIDVVDDEVEVITAESPHIYNLGRLTLSWGQVTLLAFVAGYGLIQFLDYVGRKSQGLNTRPLGILGVQLILLTVVSFFVAHVADQDRGVPVVGIILLVFLVVLTFVTKNTQFGRFVYAVGGNPEAARRAGITVMRIRIIVFILSSTLAGMGGIILASRLGSVATNAGGGNILLNAIAAAVIGGTSLFGGRGRISSAVLGALVIASVDNGMGLLNLSSGDKFIITGIVLLVAVIVDSLSLRRQQQSGIA